MKNITVLFICFTFVFSSIGQDGHGTILDKKVASVQLKDMEGNAFNTAKLGFDGTIYSFWATWCVPCINELNNYAELYEDWQDETGVKIIAVSIDDSRNMSKVKPKDGII